MLFNRTRLILLSILLVISFYGEAKALVTGYLEWDYAHYDAEEGNASLVDVTTFAQKYSVLYQKRGLIMDGRGGKYELALGGEWAALDRDVDLLSIAADSDFETSKVLYNGDLVFAPAGLPFKFRMYSKDLTSSYFERTRSDGNFVSSRIDFDNDNILNPQVVEDISDGERRETGIALEVGIKNGSYLGRYRDVLSHFPKLFVDYHELYVKDLDTFTPEHYKDREMAFVSLNKKNNWFHYRFFDHEDEITPSENYSEYLILLGTINQDLKREWINLTNWIKISTDGSYQENRYPTLQNDRDGNVYSFNFFLTTNRPKVNTALYSNFRRSETTKELEGIASIPFYAFGAIDRNTSWRAQVIGNSEKVNRPFSLVNQEITENNLYASTRFDLNKKEAYNISPYIAAETNSEDLLGEGEAVRLGVDVSSNPSFIKGYSLVAGLELAAFSGEPFFVSISEDKYWEIVAKFDYTKYLSSRLSTGVKSDFAYGSGDSRAINTDYIEAASISTFSTSSNVTELVLDESLLAHLAWFVEHLSLNRVQNRLEVEADYSEVDGTDYSQLTIGHRLDYSKNKFDFNMLNKFSTGDRISSYITSNSTNVGTGGSVTSGTFDGSILSTSTKVGYYPNRYWEHGAGILYEMLNSDAGEDSEKIYFTQSAKYVKYYSNAIRRRMYDVEQFFEYENVTHDVAQDIDLVGTGLLLHYYPLSWTRLSSKIKYQEDLESEIDEIGFGLYADFDFSKLDVRIEYENGMRTDESTGIALDRDEQRWRINVKKLF